MAMCVMDVFGAAPCQCFSSGAIQTTSPGRMSSTGPPLRCTRPTPAVTTNVWPNGWVCQFVGAPGSNVTLPPVTRTGSGAVGLYTSDALIHQYFDFDATVFRSSRLRLVGCCCSIFSHRTRRDDMPYRHTALLHQESYHCSCTSLT